MYSQEQTDIEKTYRTLRPEPPMEPQPSSTPPIVQETVMLQQSRAAVGKTCPFCGAVNTPEALFCAQCGQPISKTACPQCGAEIDPDADFCEVCHHYIRHDVCSYCGTPLAGNEVYCPECGSPRGGLVCPTCHTLNDFAFCKKCGTALTEEARQLVRQLQKDEDYQQLLAIVREYLILEDTLPFNSERDILKERAAAELRVRVLTLLAQDEGVEHPVIAQTESHRMAKEELDQRKNEKLKQLSAILDKLAVPPMASPVKARNYAMASKPFGVRLAWVCNYKHAMHSSPCGCAKPHLGGKWVVLGKNKTDEIKDDK